MGRGQQERMVPVGRISGLYGVQGWLRVFSFTEPRENIITYQPWYLNRAGEWRTVQVQAGRRQGKGVVAKLEGCNDRDSAAALIGNDIAICRNQLPTADTGEYYWADLVGLRVRTVEGVELGTVDHLMETGANDVLVVRGDRERLIPFVRGPVIREVDLERGCIEVDWDPQF
jgi:16S rRNA processing protein RimM